MNNVLIFDTTLRDGEQTPGVNLNVDEKVEIARQLERLGVDVIEAGFAGSSKGDYAAVEAVAAHVKQSTVASLARCVNADIEAAAKALSKAAKPRLHVFIPASNIHLDKKLGISADEAIERAANAVRYARTFTDDVEFSAEDASRAEFDTLVRMFEAAIREGASTINLTDTVGYATANEFSRLAQDIMTSVKGMDRAILSVHCHNDLGLACANSLVAVRHGARQVECTVLGLGERAGNASLEEIVMGIATRGDYYNARTNVDTRQLYVTGRLVSALTGAHIPQNKPIIGENAFLHQSGIHQHGVMRDRSTYEIMNPADIGVPAAKAPLGKLSGRHAFVEEAIRLGFNVDSVDIDAAFAKFKDTADKKKVVEEQDLLAILSDRMALSPDSYALHSYQLFAGNLLTPTATVTLTRGDDRLTEAAVGDGPIDAVFKAVDRIAGVCPTLERYNIRAVTGGQDAMGEVTVRIRDAHGRAAVGRGVSTDIIQASIQAYVAAINRSQML